MLPDDVCVDVLPFPSSVLSTLSPLDLDVTTMNETVRLL